MEQTNQDKISEKVKGKKRTILVIVLMGIRFFLLVPPVEANTFENSVSSEPVTKMVQPERPQLSISGREILSVKYNVKHSPARKAAGKIAARSKVRQTFRNRNKPVSSPNMNASTSTSYVDAFPKPMDHETRRAGTSIEGGKFGKSEYKPQQHPGKSSLKEYEPMNPMNSASPRSLEVRIDGELYRINEELYNNPRECEAWEVEDRINDHSLLKKKVQKSR